MFDRELLKGSTSLLVLQLLAERDMYGYELVRELDKRSANTLQMREGTLYPALHKLEKQGYIEHYSKAQSKGPTRKYYRILDAGSEILDEKTLEWHRYVKVISKMIDGPET